MLRYYVRGAVHRILSLKYMIHSYGGGNIMAVSKLETERLLLRKFNGGDLEALYFLLMDEDVNTFLPWFPVKNPEETRAFYEKRLAKKEYCYATTPEAAASCGESTWNIVTRTKNTGSFLPHILSRRTL